VNNNWITQGALNGTSGTAMSPTSSQNERADFNANADARQGFYDIGPNSTGSIAMDLSAGFSRWGVVLVELTPAGAGTTAVKQQSMSQWSWPI